MKRKNIILTGLLLASIFTFAQTKFVEKVSKKGNELVIPYEKYILSNGLTLLIHEDHSDPIVHVDIMYHVGSAREQIGKSGFAHFFEHMMFQGSDHVADDEHFKIVSEAGGTLNGNTTSDRTDYFETLPSNQLETALWLEADRMGFLLDAVTQQKFENQRATVKNERGQNVDNKPYGVVNEKINQALYPYGHPYSWPTIGYVEDLDRVDANDLKKFFLRWYGPNNAVLTVAGDVDPKNVVKLVEKYFASIPKGPEVKLQTVEPVKLEKDRYISYGDNIKFPLLQFVFPTVANRHPDEAPLDVLAEIFGGNKNSILYQNFVKTQKALRASASNPCQELAGTFTISVLPTPGNSLADMEKAIRSAIDEFEKKGVSDEDLQKYKASYESMMINSLSSVNGKATQLSSYQTYTGNPNYIKEDMQQYLKVTREDVMRVFNTYIKNKAAVILSVYPKGKPEMAAKPDNFKPPVINPADGSNAEYKDLVYKKPVDNFDRSQKPKSGTNPVLKVPALWKETFANGLKIMGTKNEEIPSVVIQLSIKAGHRLEEKSKAGIAQLMTSLMNESTEKYSAEQMSDELDKLGSSIDISSGTEEIKVMISSLTKNIDATLKLAEEMLFHPKFDKDEFDRIKNQQLQNITNQVTQATVIANNIYSKLLYGDKSIMSLPSIGTTTTVNTITLEDVKTYYKKNFSPNIASLIVVGDAEKEQMLPKLAFLKNWKSTDVKLPINETPAKMDKTKIYLVDKANAPQSEIRIGYMALPYDATGEFYKSTIMNYALGGAFNSRINLNLRENKGYTYGAKSNFSGSKYTGPFTAEAGVRTNVTDSAVIEFIKEIKKYSETGITNEELAFTKNSLGQVEALKYETPMQKAGFLKRVLDYELNLDFVNQQNLILKNITQQEINQLAKKELPLNNMLITVVGDKKIIYEGLSKLGYEIVELNAEGKAITQAEQMLYQQNK